MKNITITTIGVLASMISYLVGGFSTALIALCIIMAVDIATGLTNALVFKKSKKTLNGRASSQQGIKGITKKFLILFMVVVAHQMDLILKVSFIRDGVIVAYAAMEALSVVENMAFMGLPVPKVVMDALEIMNKKNEKSDEEDKE